MAIFKCKICGGALEIDSAQSVATCEYCGTKQTLPRLDDERRANLYDRANHFRRNNDFDKAMGIFEQILNEEPTDTEAYWSIVLCRYGIEYVEDPATHRRVPTINRAQFTSIFDDENYKSAIANADGYQREIYEAEANAINELQKNILAISQKEEPFDVFICYKETDVNGRRTQDSVLATELYHELTKEGFKVFFSRITLEDKLGVAYEPYIFAALNSAKVMVVLGTRPEHFNAVWVKNEWSRYLALIKNGARKMLIPAYRDMDPYDLPEEFSHLQAQDMSKLGFMQDLVHGIKKMATVSPQKVLVASEPVEPVMAVNITPLLDRAFLFLEDGEFERADEFCEQVLNQDPKNAIAYIAKTMVDLRIHKQEEFPDFAPLLEQNANYQKAIRFSAPALANTLKDYILQGKYNHAKLQRVKCKTEADFKLVAKEFSALHGFKDAETLQKECLEKAEIARKNAIYAQGVSLIKTKKYGEAASEFASIPGYKDAEELVQKCREKAEAQRMDTIYQEAQARASRNTSEAMQEAAKLFSRIPNWRDAAERAVECSNKVEELKKKEKINKKRNIIIGSSILAVLIIAIVITVLYQSLVVNIEKDGIHYEKAGGEFHIVGYSGSATELEIPAEVNGKPITAIENGAFSNNPTLTNIIVPNTIKKIGFGAFQGCTSLSSITLPFVGESETNTENTHFGYVFGAQTREENKKYVNALSLNTVIITGGKSIALGAFENCTLIESLTLPFVGANADGTENTNFGYIFGATLATNHSKYLPNSLQFVTITGGSKIDDRAFYDCQKLRNINLPESIATIGDEAFYGCEGLTDLYIPQSVTTVGKKAFEGCIGLTNFVVPNSVTSIGKSVFANCSNLTSITLPFVGSGNAADENTCLGYLFGAPSYAENKKYVPATLKDVIITTATKIGSSAFEDCISIEKVVIAASVTELQSCAFLGCESLKQVIFEEGSQLKTIGDAAFADCVSLTEMIIPDGTQNIGDEAFENCTALVNVKIPSSVTHIGAFAFDDCPNITTFIVPASMTNIGDYAFGDRANIVSISVENGNPKYHSDQNCLIETATNTLILGCNNSVIPNYITSIAADAFYGCAGLTEVAIPAGVTSIAADAFYGCAGLTEVAIPAGITSIGDGAFSCCIQLKSILIPANVATIGNGVFDGCAALESVSVDANNTNYFSQDGILYNAGKTVFLHIPARLKGAISIPYGITSIAASLFAGYSDLTSISLPASVTSIGSAAFAGCSNLESVVLPFVGGSIKTTTDTYQYPFGYIFGTSKYQGAVAVTQHYVGSNTSQLTSSNYYIPASLKSVTILGGHILNSAFSYCSNLETIIVPSDITGIELGAFVGCTSLKEFNIPTTVTYIGAYAFEACESLTEIVVPSSVIEIGISAFYNCTSLAKITLPFIGATLDGTSNTHFGYIFGVEKSSEQLDSVPPSLKVVVLTGSTSIGSNAFDRCDDLEEITIPPSVTSVGANAFWYCLNLTTVYISDLSAWCNINFSDVWSNPMSFAKNLYLNESPLTTLEFPSTMTSIKNYTFEGCKQITSITIPSSIVSIGNAAFSGCSGLTSIAIPESVTSIGNSAFSECSGLTSIVIPEGVTSIGDFTFSRCSGLTSIAIPWSVTSIGKSAFNGCSSLTSITIPRRVTSIGESAFEGCDSLIDVTFENTTGWWRVASSTATSSVHISGLDNTYTAATYLISTYCNYYWNRK